jgi:hypothetical protein
VVRRLLLVDDRSEIEVPGGARQQVSTIAPRKCGATRLSA